MGDNVVDCYAATGLMYPGGNCLNVAVLARRFGAETAYIGAIGQDPAGDAIAAALTAEAVDVSRLRRLDGATGYCIIGHDDTGDRVFVSFDLGVSMFSPDAGDLAFLAKADVVHIGQSSGLDDRLCQIAQIAPLSFDFSDRTDARYVARVAPLCWLASASGGRLTDAESVQLVHRIAAAGAGRVLVTRGERGALLWDGERLHETPAVPASVIDTLGAGDTAIARVLVGLLGGEPPAETLANAMSEAAETCARHGAVGHGVPVRLAVPFPA